MKERSLTACIAIMALSLLAVLLFSGATRPTENPRWSISAVSGGPHGLYIMDQQTGDIFFLDDDPNISRSHARIRKLGNVASAR
jgi:hypothetical protein